MSVIRIFKSFLEQARGTDEPCLWCGSLCLSSSLATQRKGIGVSDVLRGSSSCSGLLSGVALPGCVSACVCACTCVRSLPTVVCWPHTWISSERNLLPFSVKIYLRNEHQLNKCWCQDGSSIRCVRLAQGI